MIGLSGSELDLRAGDCRRGGSGDGVGEME